VAVRLEELPQGCHRQLVPAADVDAAEEDEVSGNREPEDAMKRDSDSLNQRVLVLPRNV